MSKRIAIQFFYLGRLISSQWWTHVPQKGDEVLRMDKYDPVARKLYSAPYVVVSVEWAVRQCSRTPLVLVELTCQDNGTEAADTAAGDVVRC